MTASDSKTIRVLYEQFHVLRAETEKIEPETADRANRPGTGITVVIRWFNRLLEQAKTLLADDPALLASITGVQSVAEIQEYFESARHRIARQEVILGTNMVLQALGLLLIGSEAAASAVAVEREGLFLPGQHFDAMQLAWKLLSQAQRSIAIIDGYVDHRVLDLLKGKGGSVTVAILTKPWSAPRLDCAPWGRKMRREAPWAIIHGRQTAGGSLARSSSGRRSSAS